MARNSKCNSTPRSAAYRRRIYEYDEVHEALKKNDREWKPLQRMKLKKNKLMSEKQTMKNSAYQRKWWNNKKIKEGLKKQTEMSDQDFPTNMSTQSIGKALHRILKVMPKSSDKKVAVADELLQKCHQLKNVH